MPGHVLNEFVHDCALPYLDQDHPDVRRAAALTCCRLFVRDPICYQASNHSIEIISDVIDKLLTVAIADPGTSSRSCVVVHVFTSAVRRWHPTHCPLLVTRTLRQASCSSGECEIVVHCGQRRGLRESGHGSCARGAFGNAQSRIRYAVVTQDLDSALDRA